VVLRDIAALNKDGFTVLEISPVVRHRAPSEGGPQTGDGGAMSKTGLVFDEGKSKQARRLLE
jgi:hypothetical protein